mmetsp:Transcript_2092/g.4940  ORF Transcript_2092/g.4940 Transcript_2092/m.4940 type:complete len:898 (-) Transcript_2092:613-3306(-)
MFGKRTKHVPKPPIASESGPPGTLIERLIILHDGLIPPSGADGAEKTPRRNPTALLSEDASLEEHAEFILYYYEHSLHHDGRRSRTPDEMGSQQKGSVGSEASSIYSIGNRARMRDDHSSEEAVQFAGLCRALRSLPRALSPEIDDASEDPDNVDETDVVCFNASTLVFVPLELNGDVLAVAQIPRSGSNFGANPAAVHLAIKRMHAQFSLFEGGGIHRRLLMTKSLEESSDWVLEEVLDCDEDKTGDDDYYQELELLMSKDTVRDGHSSDNARKKDGVARKTNRNIRRTTRQLSGSITAEIFTSANGDKNRRQRRSLDNDYQYGGMKELLRLRKDHRKLSSELDGPEISDSGQLGSNDSAARWKSSVNAEDLFLDIVNEHGQADCQRQIDGLLKLLPITKLREDLMHAYDKSIRNLQGMCEAAGRTGIARCVIEMVPGPLCVSRHLFMRGQHPPRTPEPFVCLAGAEFMNSLLSDEHTTNMEVGDCRLFGLSMLYRNQVVLTQFADSFDMSIELIHMIFDRFRGSASRATEAIDSDAKQSEPNNAPPLIKWIKAQNKPQPLSHDASRGSGDLTADSHAGFRSCDPSETNDVEWSPNCSVFVAQLNRSVWLPRISPLKLRGNGVQTHVGLFESDELSFLTFFELQSSHDEVGILEQLVSNAHLGIDDTAKVSNVEGRCQFLDPKSLMFAITKANGQLDAFCNTFKARDVDSSNLAPIKDKNDNRLFLGEAGMDIIFVDRVENKFILLSRHDLTSDEFIRQSSRTECTPPKFGLFGIGKDTVKRNDDGTKRLHEFANMMDCRHRLAAHLSHETMLALDDVFCEIRNRASRIKSKPPDNEAKSKSIEVTTFLPQSWIHGRAYGEMELYVLLDTSRFVTINDVQRATTRVRERLLNDRIR